MVAKHVYSYVRTMVTSLVLMLPISYVIMISIASYIATVVMLICIGKCMYIST